MAASRRQVSFRDAGEDTCKFCSKQANYTCPRCNVRYCSSDCYKEPAHASCSEQFYKDCVLTELKQHENPDEVKQKTMHILKRAAEQQANDSEDSDDEFEFPTLEERFADMDLETDDVDADQMWSRLTDEEKKEFERLRSEHRLEELVPPWEPWWQFKIKAKLVEEMGKQPKEPEVRGLPSIMKEIMPLKTLVPKSTPSTTVAYSVVNILYAYAVTTRLHDGDHQKMATDAAEVVLAVSAALGNKQNFDDVATAACSALKAARELTSFNLDTSFLLTAIQDLIQLISGPNSTTPALYSLAALSDLHSLFKSAAKNKTKDVQRKQVYKAATKKLVFLLSWVQDCGQALQPLLPHLQLLHDETLSETMAQQLREEQEAASLTRLKTQQKPLIQEVGSS